MSNRTKTPTVAIAVTLVDEAAEMIRRAAEDLDALITERYAGKTGHPAIKRRMEAEGKVVLDLLSLEGKLRIARGDAPGIDMGDTPERK